MKTRDFILLPLEKRSLYKRVDPNKLTEERDCKTDPKVGVKKRELMGFSLELRGGKFN